ncbi:MAG: hypothetical protein QOI24_3066 [Acidobacteriota bacterium]|jgi:hypothetical protein|nr:hypothetical protein [Acidobacteriota bacterium]
MTDEELKGLFTTLREEISEEISGLRTENADAHTVTRHYLETRLAAVHEELAGMRAENAEAHADTRAYVDRGLDAVRRENADAHAATRQHVDNSFSTMRRENAAAHIETRRHMDVIGEHIAERFQFLVESVQFVDQKLDRNVARLEERIDRSAGDTQSLVRYAYGQLDHRISRLE